MFLRSVHSLRSSVRHPFRDPSASLPDATLLPHYFTSFISLTSEPHAREVPSTHFTHAITFSFRHSVVASQLCNKCNNATFATSATFATMQQMQQPINAFIQATHIRFIPFSHFTCPSRPATWPDFFLTSCRLVAFYNMQPFATKQPNSDLDFPPPRLIHFAALIHSSQFLNPELYWINLLEKFSHYEKRKKKKYPPLQKTYRFLPPAQNYSTPLIDN